MVNNAHLLRASSAPYMSADVYKVAGEQYKGLQYLGNHSKDWFAL